MTTSDPAISGEPPRALESARLGIKANLSQFLLLIIINAFVGAMIGMERSILPLIASEEFHLTSHRTILSFIAIFGISKAITNYFAGRWSDRSGRKRVLLWGWLIALPVPWLLMWSNAWWHILGANILLGISQGLTWSTTVIMKVDLAGPKRRGLALGINELAGYLSVGLSALATSYLASRFGLRPYPFYLGVAFSILGGGLSLIWVRETLGFTQLEVSQTREHPDDHLSQREVMIRTSLSDPDLSSVSQAGLVNNLNDGMAWGLFPLIFITAGQNVTQVGILTSIYPVMWGIGQLGMGAWSDRVGRKPLIVSGMWIQSLGIVVISLSRSFSLLALGSSLLGLGTAMVYPTLLAAIGDVARPKWRASAIGIYRLWRDMGYAVGALLAGYLADRFGLQDAALVIALLTFASGTYVAIRMRETLHRAITGEQA